MFLFLDKALCVCMCACVGGESRGGVGACARCENVKLPCLVYEEELHYKSYVLTHPTQSVVLKQQPFRAHVARML